MSSLVFKSALELGRMLKRRKISSRELLDECLSQYTKHNGKVNAVIVTDFDRAKKSSAAADRRLARGKSLSPFDGVPMTAKESFDWAGTPSTWGDPKLAKNIATKDAVAISRMTDAGAVMYGKTNVPYMLADWQSFNKVYGTTGNPWDVRLTPGGSSGGAAASLATGMSALEIGSDIGASIRNPAHFCGVYGHKPTFGVVPEHGQTLPGRVSFSDIAVTGPLARSARDLTAMMKLLAGPAGIEAHGLGTKLPSSPKKRLKDFRVAIKLNSKISDVDQPVQDLIAACGSFLTKRVKKLSFEAHPDLNDDEIYHNYITLLRATATEFITQEEYDSAFAKAQTFAKDDMSYMALTTRAYAMSHRDWLLANERRHQMRYIWEAFFEEWDVLLIPTAASAAWPHNHEGERQDRMIVVNGKQVSGIDQRFWAGYSCNFFLPSTAVPLGLTPQGLPSGMQIVAREYGDYTALRFAELLEEEFYSFTPPPGY
jgi:amidase